jgi:hypothetical protein
MTIDVVAATPEADAEVAPPPTQPDEPDDVARVCAASPNNLASAVARHLLRMGQDTTYRAVGRLQAIRALGILVSNLEREVAAELVAPLLAIHSSPQLSGADLMDIQMNNPLSRFRMGGGPQIWPLQP